VNRLAFRDDPALPLLESLEPQYQPAVSKEVALKQNAEPRPARRRRPTSSSGACCTVEAAPEGRLEREGGARPLAQHAGAVDLDYMAELYGKDAGRHRAELHGVVYLNPQGSWETAEQYLSGNVKAKLAAAQHAAKQDDRFGENVLALEKVIPADIDALDINVFLGSPWVPTDDMKAFVPSTCSASRRASSSTCRRSARGPSPFRTARPRPTRRRGAPSACPPTTIIAHLANGEAVVVYDVSRELRRAAEKRVKNEKETEAAQVKADEVARAFRTGSGEDPERRKRLARLYNDTYNTNRTRDYDGSHLTFPGMSPTVQLRKHQKGVVWRILQDRVVLLDHVVGAGKTFAAAAGVMELKRLGMARKTMLTVPNHLVRQWRDEFYRLYPNANILVPSEKDFEKKNRAAPVRADRDERLGCGDRRALVVPEDRAARRRRREHPQRADQRHRGGREGDEGQRKTAATPCASSRR
jgi:N12 class adenine-specific DNA methylase